MARKTYKWRYEQFFHYLNWRILPLRHWPSSSSSLSMTKGGESAVTTRKAVRALEEIAATERSPPGQTIVSKRTDLPDTKPTFFQRTLFWVLFLAGMIKKNEGRLLNILVFLPVSDFVFTDELLVSFDVLSEMRLSISKFATNDLSTLSTPISCVNFLPANASLQASRSFLK